MIKNKYLLFLFLILGLVVVFLGLYPKEKIVRTPPRTLPWTLPDYTQAKTQVEVLPDGRLKIEIKHLFLKDISPQMISWFYKVLPVTKVTLNNEPYPLYHLFHPSEHGEIWVEEPALNGQPGMGVGALVSRNEWFGEFDSRGSGRVIEFNEFGMKVQPEIAGMHFGLIHHEYVFQKDEAHFGTQYYVHSIIGSDWPVLGPVINYFVRNVMFPEEKLNQWLRHQIEEVSSLQFFLPVLYQTQAFENQYKIRL